MLIFLAEALENLADEVMALDTFGPIDYIESKIDVFLMNVDDFISDLTTEPKSEEAYYTEDDEIWDDSVCEETEPDGEEVMEKEKAVVDTEPEQEEESTTILQSEEMASEETGSASGAESSAVKAERQKVGAESDGDSCPDMTSPAVSNTDTTDFYNAHMDKIREIIADTAKKLNASAYSEQQEYLQDVFELSGGKCWDYLEKELAEEKGKQGANLEMLNSITERDVKEVVAGVATGMFLQLAFEALAKSD